MAGLGQSWSLSAPGPFLLPRASTGQHFSSTWIFPRTVPSTRDVPMSRSRAVHGEREQVEAEQRAAASATFEQKLS